MREREDVALTLGPTLSLSGLGQVRLSQLEGWGLEFPQDPHTCAAQAPNGPLSAGSLHTVLGHHLEPMSWAAPANSPEVSRLG